MIKKLYGNILWEKCLFTEGALFVLSIDLPPVVLVVKGKWNPNSFETLLTTTNEYEAIQFAEKYFEDDYHSETK
jgi:hypothetical protein